MFWHCRARVQWVLGVGLGWVGSRPVPDAGGRRQEAHTRKMVGFVMCEGGRRHMSCGGLGRAGRGRTWCWRRVRMSRGGREGLD